MQRITVLLWGDKVFELDLGLDGYLEVKDPILNVVAGHFDGLLGFPGGHLGDVSGNEEGLTKMEEFWADESELDLLDGLGGLSFLFRFHVSSK